MLYFIIYYTLDNASRIGRTLISSWPVRNSAVTLAAIWGVLGLGLIAVGILKLLSAPQGFPAGTFANMAAMSMENHQVLLNKLNT